MQDYGPETYGDRIAAEYDALYERELDTDATIEIVCSFTRLGPTACGVT